MMISAMPRFNVFVAKGVFEQVDKLVSISEHTFVGTFLKLLILRCLLNEV